MKRRGGRRPGNSSRSSGRLERIESPRGLAASIVRGVLGGRGAARTHLERAFERRRISERDQALMTELVYGTVRHVGTLDHLLAGCAKGGLGRVEEGILAHLRVAAYQLLYCENIAAGVAVNEAVAAAGRRSHVRGYVNGVLRNLERQVSGAEPGGEELPQPGTRCLPGRGATWLLLSKDLLPDPEVDPAGWLAVAASLPRSLAASWVARFGLPQALAVARAQNAPPPLTLRANRLRGTRDELLAELLAAGLTVHPTTGPNGIVVRGGLGDGANDPLFSGRATVQDATAMHVAPFLAPEPGQRVVDLCAAPGGKTTHLAELMNDEGVVEALDVEEERLNRVRKAVSRLGLKAVACHLVDPLDPRPPEGAPIDRVLADVPCSNSGVLRRRVEVRWRIESLDRVPLLALQARLFDRAVELLRPGGRLVYSTCSIEPDENQDQVAAGLTRHAGLSLIKEVQTLPTVDGGDGGYMALLERGK